VVRVTFNIMWFNHLACISLHEQETIALGGLRGSTGAKCAAMEPRAIGHLAKIDSTPPKENSRRHTVTSIVCHSPHWIRMVPQ